MKEQLLFDKIDSIIDELCSMSDFIFDHPEFDGKEYQASELLCSYLEKNGFVVEKGIAGLDTAFKAVYHHGSGGPNFGLLVEYDALEGIGHACGHHMQGPALAGAAVALKELADDLPFTLTVYGTPAEESFGGKINMLNAGYITECDVALMFHASQTTTTDIKCMAIASYICVFMERVPTQPPAPSWVAAHWTLCCSALTVLSFCGNMFKMIRGSIIPSRTAEAWTMSYPTSQKVPLACDPTTTPIWTPSLSASRILFKAQP